MTDKTVFDPPSEPHPEEGRQSSRRLLLLVGVAALLVAVWRRLIFGWDDRLGFDETFTGAIASGESLAELVTDLLSEVGGPVYYTFMWLWEKLFGASNVSLRAPSLIFALATPAVILLKGHPDRQIRLLWAALTALWVPSFYFAAEARAYTLLIFLGTVQTLLFIRLLAQPSLARAFAWAALSAVLVLSHYHALLLTALQGLGYLAVHRATAFRTWPAALAFAPVAIWMYFHLPILLLFASPAGGWQRLLGLQDIRLLAGHLAGFPKMSAVPVLAVGVALMWETKQGLKNRTWPLLGRAESIAALASILAILIVFLMGFIRPNYTSRYLFPYIPGALFAVAALVRIWGRRMRLLPASIVAGMILVAFWDVKVRLDRGAARQVVSWDRASQDLAAAGARRLIFFLDYPETGGTAPPLLEKVGAFFLRREGHSIESIALNSAELSEGGDPRRRLLDIANQPRDAIIWIFGRDEPRSIGMSLGADLDRLDPSLRCRDYGAGYFAVVACVRGGAIRPYASRAEPADLGTWRRHSLAVPPPLNVIG